MKKKLLCTILVGTMMFASPVYAKDLTVTVPSYVTEAGLSDFPDSQKSSTTDDGSTTYTLNKDQQKSWKKYLKTSLDSAIKAVLDDKENYPNIEGMTYNKDMTEFKIDLSSTDSMTMSEAFVGYIPLFYAPLYQEVNGVPEDKIDYKIVSTDSSTGDKHESDYEQNKADWESSFFSNSSTSAAASGDVQNTSSDTVDVIAFNSDTSSLEYSGFETMPYDDSSDGTLGVVKFNYTNKVDAPTDSVSLYSIKAYQNGIELEWYAGTGNTACDNTYKTILKDTTLEVGFAFMLQDTTSPITVYAYDGYSGNAPCQIQEIAIQ